MWKILFISAFIPICIFLNSCKSNSNHTSKNLHVFKYNECTGISSTDPAYAKDQSTMWCVNHLYNGLVQLDSQLNIQPSIAKEWSISSDGLTYTFKLRNDVYFIDDKCFISKRKLVSTDIVYSFNRILNPQIASPGAWIFRNKVDAIMPFLAINDSVFQLKLLQPFPPMLSILSMQYAFIVPHEAVTYYGRQFAYHPVGTGPFKLKAWEEGNAMYLIKNESYFEYDGNNRLPYLDAVKITFIENKKTEILAFKSNQLSFITDISASNLSEIINDTGQLRSELIKTSTITKCPYLKTEYIGFNLSDKDLIDKKVRLALNYCFDRHKLIHYLRFGIGNAAIGGMIPNGLAAFDTAVVKGYTYNLELAKNLVNDAKKEGNLHPITLYTNENYKEFGIYIANEATKIGIDINVEVVQPVLLREWNTQGKVSCFRASWIADYPDAESFMCLFYSKNSAPPNYTRFNNSVFDHLYEKSLLENDIKKRIELYHQMETLIIAEAPVIPIYYDEVIRLTKNNIIGLTPNALNLLDLKRVRIKL